MSRNKFYRYGDSFSSEHAVQSRYRSLVRGYEAELRDPEHYWSSSAERLDNRSETRDRKSETRREAKP
jgi:hypothetical protein